MTRSVAWLAIALCLLKVSETAGKITFHQSLSEESSVAERFARVLLESRGPTETLQDAWRSLRRSSSPSPSPPPCYAPPDCVLADSTRCEHDGVSTSESNVTHTQSPTSYDQFTKTWSPTAFGAPAPTFAPGYVYASPDNTCACDCTCTSSSGSGSTCTQTCMDADTCETIMILVGSLVGAFLVIGCCIGACGFYVAYKRRSRNGTVHIFPQLNQDGTPKLNPDGTPACTKTTASWVPAAAQLPGQGGAFGGQPQVQGMAMQPTQGMNMQGNTSMQHNMPMQTMNMQGNVQQPMYGNMQQPMQGMAMQKGGMQQPLQGMPMNGIDVQGMNMQQPMYGNIQQPMQGMQQFNQGMPMQQPIHGMSTLQPIQGSQQQAPIIVTATPV